MWYNTTMQEENKTTDFESMLDELQLKGVQSARIDFMMKALESRGIIYDSKSREFVSNMLWRLDQWVIADMYQIYSK